MNAKTHAIRHGIQLRLVLAVFKLRIGLMIALTALTGAAVQPGVPLSAMQWIVLFFGTLLAAAAAGAFNQYYEADLDARMRRTSQRPFVSGRLARRRGWVLLIVAVGGAGVLACALWLNLHAALFTFLGAFTYGVVYTVWLKRRTVWNIVIGGAAGSFAVLAGAAAVAPQLSLQAWLLAAVLFLWTPPHFWSLAIVCRADYAAAQVPMLPVALGDAYAAHLIAVHVAALVALSWLLIPLSGWAYALPAVAGGLLFLRAALRLQRAPTRSNARLSFRASLLQLGLLLGGAMLDAAIRL